MGNSFHLKPMSIVDTEGVSTPESRPIQVYHSTDITKPSAQVLMAAYRNHNKKLVNSSGETIKGVYVDYDDIKKLKEDNSDLTKIFIAFAVNSSDFYDASIPQHDKSFTTILFGVKPNDAAPNGELIDSSAIDFCDPCPPICPCVSTATNSALLGFNNCT